MKTRHCHIAAGVAALWTGCALAAVLTPGGTEIVVEKKSPRVVKFAAKEMKHFLDGVLSCDVPIVEAPSGTRTPIHLGSDRWTKAAGISASLRLCAIRDGVEEHTYLEKLSALAADKTAEESARKSATALCEEYRALVPVPNAGGRYSSKILPEPEVLDRLRNRAGELLSAFGMGED